MSEILNILGTVGFNWHVALANFFNFLIILFLLQKFFFGKIRSVVQKRAEIIEKGLNDAENAAKFLQDATKEKDTIVHAAKKEAVTIVEAAHTEGEKSALRIQAIAEEEIAARKAALTEEEENVAEKVEKEFMKKAPLLVASLYAKTLGKSATEEQNNAFIAQMKA